jgi:invasion protein IalB
MKLDRAMLILALICMLAVGASLVAARTAMAVESALHDVGIWRIECSVDHVRERKTCFMTSGAWSAYRVDVTVGSAGGIYLSGSYPTRGAIRVDQNAAIEASRCMSSICTFPVADMVKLLTQMRSGKTLAASLTSYEVTSYSSGPVTEEDERPLTDFNKAWKALQAEQAAK